MAFILGDVVEFDCDSFTEAYWASLTETQKCHYYQRYGYGNDKQFVFITEVKGSDEHCILISLDDGAVEVMAHKNNFKLVESL